MASREHRKSLRSGGHPAPETSTPEGWTDNAKQPEAEPARAGADADWDENLGLSELEIERLRSGLPGLAHNGRALRARDEQPNGEARVALILQGQSELLELCTKGAGLGELMEYVAGLAQRVLEPSLCSIQLVDAGAGTPCRAAALAGHGDVETGAKLDEHSEAAARHGIRACWSHPILSPDGKPWGTITVYRGMAGEPSAEDRRVLDVLATLAQFVIQAAEREDALRGANERFSSLAASIPGVVYQRRVTPDDDIRYTYISEGARDIFGVPAEEIMANPQALFDCHGPEYRDTFRERLLAASRNLEMWDVEAQIVTADGEEKWTHAIARPHLEPDGSVLWDGVILDATRIKQAEFELRGAKEAAEAANRTQAALLEKLRGANERFASLAASIPGVVYQRRVTPDDDIRYTYISEGARDIFGVSAEEIMANPQALFDCHGPEYRDTFRERLLAASRNLEMWDVEAQIVTADGEEKWTHAIARPHLEPDGSVLWDGVILDATRIKRAEFELRDAKEAAEAASRAKTLFLAQISHELRTPLNAVIGFAEMLVGQHLGPLGNPRYVEYARDIDESGRRLLGVINSILEFTKSETGKIEIRQNTVNIEQIINDILVEVDTASKEKGLSLYKSIEKGFPQIKGDHDKLEIIVRTLVSNAVKFTPDGGEIRVEAGRDKDGNIVVAVTDTGIGIAAEDIPKMFKPFAQIDDELHRKYEGIGLGISLAAAMAEMHGGSITVESKIDRGTKVCLLLPKSIAVS